ncbi:MAG: sugar ABC transporter ATP-binding protein [Actinomycetota bacterium]
MENNLLEVRNISKSFFSNKVLDNIDFTLDYGEVLGLVGENGAGKSTLVKVLTGVYKQDSGYIKIDGLKVNIENINSAKSSGIGIVFQELSLTDNLSVADNILIGRIPSNKIGFVDKKRLHRETAKLINKFKVNIKPEDIVGSLPIGDKQIVEILKAISFNPKLLILDEPTSALEDKEIESLFKLIKELKKNNYSIIYISHYLDEVFKITDDILVLRDGRKIGVFKTSEMNKEKLIKKMINKDIKDFFASETKGIKSEQVLLEVINITDSKILRNISFKLYRGEILGLVGLAGSGKIDACKVIYGLSNNVKGKILIKGKEVQLNNPVEAKKNHISFISEDRKGSGLFLRDNVSNNIIASVLKKVSKFNFLSNTKIVKETKRFIDLLKIKISSVRQKVTFLSGGNQQKVMVAKCLAHDPKIIIAIDPTKGIDVGSKKDIHEILRKVTRKGAGVLLISSELDEVINMSDRIIVFVNGRITKEIQSRNFDSHEITLAINKTFNTEERYG